MFCAIKDPDSVCGKSNAHFIDFHQCEVPYSIKMDGVLLDISQKQFLMFMVLQSMAVRQSKPKSIGKLLLPKKSSCKLPLFSRKFIQGQIYQQALDGEAHLILNNQQDNEGEKGQDVDQAANQSSNVCIVEEYTDEIAHGYDGEAVVQKVQEQDHNIYFWKDIPKFENKNKKYISKQEKYDAFDEPSKEMTAGIYTHHLHILWKRKKMKTS